MKSNLTIAALLALFSAHVRAEEQAQPAAPPPQTGAAEGAAEAKEGKKEAATREEVRALAEELRRLKLEIGLKDLEYQSFGGMGPAASKVYFAPKGLSIGGYGELNYVNSLEGAKGDATDLLRLVLYAGYRFNERIVFNSEIEFEHAGKEVAVEFAYLDFLLSDPVQLRVGNLLVPMGFVNQMHEPAFFNGVFRPDVETSIIPTTWNENGVGLHGEVAGLRYKAYLLAGLDVLVPRDEKAEPVETGSWLRRARTGAAEARAATFAGVLALEYAAGPATLGGSLYRGRADQRRVPGVKADVTLAEAHAQVAWKGAVARVIGVVGTLGDAAAVSEVALEPGEVLGSRVEGGYVEVGYDVMSLVAPGGETSVSPFVRFERLDLAARIPSGFTRDPGLDRTVLTAGVTYKPIPTVVMKADWQRKDSRAGAPAGQLNLGAGFVF